jgi:hypothetical protein
MKPNKKSAMPLPSYDLCLSPTGNDAWTGVPSEPTPNHQDGPIATLVQAQVRLRHLRRQGQLPAQARVMLRGGVYALPDPLEFGPEDSGTTFEAWSGEKVVLSGARRVKGWEKTKLGNLEVWTASLAGLGIPGDAPRSLFVNGQRARRPVVGGKEWLWMESVPGLNLSDSFGLFDTNDAFIHKPGDINPAWRNLDQIEILVSHFWIMERSGIASYDPETRRVRLKRQSLFPLRDAWDNRFAKYRIENVFEALSEPGEFYADPKEQRVWYVPRPGEKPETAEAWVPVAYQLIRASGTPDRPVEHLEFRGIEFAHTEAFLAESFMEWPEPYPQRRLPRFRASSQHFLAQARHRVHYASAPQAAIDACGSIRFEHARYCVVEQCALKHLGGYAVELGEGAKACRILSCDFSDLGAGAVMADGGDLESPTTHLNHDHRVCDNHIRHGGRIFPAAAGLLFMHSHRNLLAHNEIHDMPYSGISCGWVWGFTPNPSRENRIEKNLIYRLGAESGLSDMGGIYMLGVQPGTVLRGNVIHDIAAANYGAWGIYLDEGSSFMTVENNVIYGALSEGVMEHWGRQNLIRNNYIAPRSGGFGIQLCGDPANRWSDYPARGCTVERNIIVLQDGAIFRDSQRNLRDGIGVIDLNCYWQAPTKGSKPTSLVVYRDEPWGHLMEPGEKKYLRDYTLPAWQKEGYDLHSIVADPKVREVGPRSFVLAKDSPAYRLGFRPMDCSDVGPRGVCGIGTRQDLAASQAKKKKAVLINPA